MKCNDFIQNLSVERSKDAEVLKKPHMAGIRTLLANKMYPDTAHFIYELLQNAEDVQATEIMFHLTSEKLIVEHNGQLFTEENIDDITSIPKESHKDVNQIGQHGLGFKSVFSYTNTPHIYSGECAFKIRDLIVPEPITPLNKQSNKTIFEFPFNNSEKTQTQAFEEIANGLRDLSTTTLLFLTNIKIINWTCADEPASYTRLHTHSEHHVEIEACVNGEVTNGTHYLRFMAKIPDKPAHLQVGLAYSLDFKKGIKSFDTSKPLAVQMRVKEETGLVSIFFPAKNATSNLSFHIHAPFATVPGRNSISDTSEVASMNEALIATIAHLAVRSLNDIKDIGLLNRAFLDVLPHDKIPAFYQPISEQIWTALRTQPLIPTYTGSFAAGEQLYHATDDKDDKLKKLLDSGDLAHLENRADEILDWCFDVPEALRSKIGIKAINATLFVQKLAKLPFTLPHWLELKDNTWVQQFYSYLQPHNLQLKQTSLVRLNDGSHVIASKAYFSSDGIVDDKDFPRVCAATYESGSEEQQEEREQAREFLKNIGVKEVTEREKIELIIKTWADANEVSDEEYLKHLPQFIKYWLQTKETGLFKDKYIFWGDSIKNGELYLCKANQLFIDSPLCETGITSWFVDEQNYYLLSKMYVNIPSLNVDDLVDFAKCLGAKMSADVTYEDIQNILRRWKTAKPNDNEYLRYLPQFIAARYHDLFKDQAIFWGDTKDGKTKLVKASEIFIDNPLQDTSVSAWYADKFNYHSLSKKYTEYTFLDTYALINFVKKLGAKDKLPIIEIRASHQTDLESQFYEAYIFDTRDKIDKDWYIADYQWDKNALEQWLTSPSEAKALAIWMTMCQPDTKAEVLTACYKRLQRPLDRIKKRDSRLVYALRSVAWTPQINEAGVTIFVTPAKATQNLLPEKFKYNDSNGWLTAIEFGKEEKARAAERQRQIAQASYTYQEKVNTAKDNGFDSPEEMAAAAALLQEAKIQGKSVAELQADLAKNSNPELPEETVPNPERRRKGVLERSENAPSRESVMRERSVQPGIGEAVAEAKAYLRAKYTNANREMVCQCCQKEMPFKINDAYYFEAVQCVKNTAKHHIENRLALCPTCAAMYLHARATDDVEVRRLVINHSAHDDASSVEIPVTLADQSRQLRFVGTHWFDLKAVLKNG